MPYSRPQNRPLSHFLLVIMLLALSGMANAKSIMPKMITPEVGQEYYTRYNFMFEKRRHVTTNYWRGELVPINTKVTLVSMSKKKMVVDIDGVPVTILNQKKHTRRGIPDIASELLSPTPIPRLFSALVR